MSSSKMVKEERKVQAALGLRKRQMFVNCGHGITETFIEELEKAIENFGLFCYPDPLLSPDCDDVGIIISDQKLTVKQRRQIAYKYWGFDKFPKITQVNGQYYRNSPSHGRLITIKI